MESSVGKGSTFYFTMLLSWADEVPSESPRPLGPLAEKAKAVFGSFVPPQGEQTSQEVLPLLRRHVILEIRFVSAAHADCTGSCGFDSQTDSNSAHAG